MDRGTLIVCESATLAHLSQQSQRETAEWGRGLLKKVIQRTHNAGFFPSPEDCTMHGRRHSIYPVLKCSERNVREFRGSSTPLKTKMNNGYEQPDIRLQYVHLRGR